MTASKPTATRSGHPRQTHDGDEHARVHAHCPKCGAKVAKKGELCLDCQLAELQRAGWHL